MEGNNETTLDTLDINIDDLFKDPEPNIDEATSQESQSNETEQEKNIMTKAVSERINSVKKKTETETQDKIAKELGYENYAELQKANEKKLIKEAGYDAEDINNLVDQLLEKRLASDPRLKKLEEYEERDKSNFVNSQLKEINNLAGSNYTSIEQLPKETLKLWEKTGNLKQAYLATEGENLIAKKANKGSLSHLADTSNSGVGTKKRALTEEEKNIWRSVIPDITDDELSKKMVDIK